MMLNNFDPYDYIDSNDALDLELNYFMSIHFGYLSLRNGNSIIIEPYSPHRFSRQFGFYQRIPSSLAYASSHEDRYWRKVRPHSDKSGDANLAMLEIPDSVESLSRTLTVLFKEGKLSESDVDCASSLKEVVQVILEEMDGKDVDVSPLMGLVKSFFESLREVKEKIEKLHRKEKDLKVLLEAIEKEVEEAKLGVSIAEKDFDACSDANLLNDDDLTDLEQKKECLEVMR
ncbi:hypothetical protein HAX54_041348 [Datura stramonium]|uniref:Uncharacterized protein n=1 Tax=Datura stramonium TaxID=4076 RepID=A0ABS8SM88_DATST|nr:hypothetical protein [Datura stramonium]